MSWNIRVYVSLASGDTRQECDALRQLTAGFNIGFAKLTTQSWPDHQSSNADYLESIFKSDLYIAAYASNGSWLAIEEFKYAKKAGVTCQLFLKHQADESPRDLVLQEFLEGLSSSDSWSPVIWYNDQNDFLEKAESFIKLWLQYRIVAEPAWLSAQLISHIDDLAMIA